MDVRELAWAAGLFEGEGCITVRRSVERVRYMYPRLILSMNDEDVVRRFHAAIGRVGTVRPWRHGKDGRMMWRWNTGRFEYVQAVVAMLWFGLGERRRARAREVFAVAMESRGLRTTQPRGPECTVDGCDRPVVARGLCNRDYLRARRSA